MAIHNTRTTELVASALRSTSSTGSSFPVQDSLEGRVYVSITAMTGTDTPTLTVTVQDSPDNTDWYTHTASAGLTSVANTSINLTNFGKYIRISWTITGTFTAGQGITFDIQFVGKS